MISLDCFFFSLFLASDREDVLMRMPPIVLLPASESSTNDEERGDCGGGGTTTGRRGATGGGGGSGGGGRAAVVGGKVVVTLFKPKSVLQSLGHVCIVLGLQEADNLLLPGDVFNPLGFNVDAVGSFWKQLPI